MILVAHGRLPDVTSFSPPDVSFAHGKLLVAHSKLLAAHVKLPKEKSQILLRFW